MWRGVGLGGERERERERGQNSNQAQILGLAMGPQQISKVSHMYVSTILVSWCCMCKGAGETWDHLLLHHAIVKEL